ncbi:MAG: cytidine deaminase [Bacteroidetes bacterium]|nr:cytidine deaminase [Bacteroidota bacterium]
MEEKEVKIRYTIYQTIEELSKEEQLLLEKAKIATKSAYAPYSGFNVGAAILLENGIIVTGNNQENAAYPSGLCAERVAMFAASSHYPDIPMKIIAITANSEKFEVNFPISPCGSCRQVMSEYETKQNQPMKVILMGSKGDIQVINTISGLLPFMFHADELKQKNI